uniref:Uncharacterized protein n=1 Tax=Rhizophora mucronata TaxID=61149 RepID=A0A2P2MZF6_RHIMU
MIPEKYKSTGRSGISTNNKWVKWLGPSFHNRIS